MCGYPQLVTQVHVLNAEGLQGQDSNGGETAAHGAVPRRVSMLMVVFVLGCKAPTQHQALNPSEDRRAGGTTASHPRLTRSVDDYSDEKDGISWQIIHRLDLHRVHLQIHTGEINCNGGLKIQI